MNENNMKEIKFEEISENEIFADYTAGCSGNVSDCCTRVCTRGCHHGNYIASEEEWGKFLEVEGGVIQY